VVVLCLVSAVFSPPDLAALCVALALFAAGCLLHVLVKGQLIRNVTLCTDGAYAVVRHPYYLANYFVDISFCLLGGNVYLVLLYPFLFYWAYGPTFAEEEATLASMHGEKFDAYRASVPQVFPTTNLFVGLSSLGRGFSWRRISAKEIKRISRFGFLATLLILAREVGGPGLRELMTGQVQLTRTASVLLGLCLTCLVVSLAIPSRGKDGNRSQADEQQA
jgi:hypothetical protein